MMIFAVAEEGRKGEPMRLIDADVLKQHIDKLPALPDGNFAGNHSALKALINMQPTVQLEEDWIPVSKDMPVEYDSVFTRFYGTDKWRDGMWLKSSAKVLVTVEFEDGTRLTETAKTIDGKWATENRIRKRKVIAWQKMPKEYKGK